jgi:hypothetical protein
MNEEESKANLKHLGEGTLSDQEAGDDHAAREENDACKQISERRT